MRNKRRTRFGLEPGGTIAPMGTPVLLAVDEDPDCLGRVEQQLRRRYGDDYRVEVRSTAAAGLSALEELVDAGEPVALVLADQWLGGGTTGAELLGRAKALHPSARRGLLIAWGAWGDPDTAGGRLGPGSPRAPRPARAR
jgi:thioredoxin reductase (NADPH)